MAFRWCTRKSGRCCRCYTETSSTCSRFSWFWLSWLVFSHKDSKPRQISAHIATVLSATCCYMRGGGVISCSKHCGVKLGGVIDTAGVRLFKLPMQIFSRNRGHFQKCTSTPFRGAVSRLAWRRKKC